MNIVRNYQQINKVLSRIISTYSHIIILLLNNFQTVNSVIVMKRTWITMVKLMIVWRHSLKVVVSPNALHLLICYVLPEDGQTPPAAVTVAQIRRRVKEMIKH
jgi:hypothetical protein